jgi:Flp pilus assembly protein TadG
LIFAVIEFGWAFFQQLDVRHGAREGARLAAVDFQSTATPTPANQTAEIVAETCSRMDSGDNVSVRLTRTGSAVGQEFEVQVSKPLDQLTGFLGPFLNNITLTSTVDSRIEQEASWTSTSGASPCP